MTAETGAATSRWSWLRRRLGGVRADIRRRPLANRLYRVGVGVVGVAIIVGGLALVPLPGPGWVIVFVGLGLLATEFAWAGRLQRAGRRLLGRWSRWIQDRSVGVRSLLAAGAAVAVCLVVWAYLAVAGTPGWLPDGVQSALVWLPGVD